MDDQIAGPEIARIISELRMKDSSRLKRSDRHHEQIPSIQSRFATNVRSVVDVFNEMGNPFTETSSDLLALDTKIIMADEVIQSIKKAEDLGTVQYKSFVEEHMVKMTKPFHDTIPKNNFTLFKLGHQKASSKSKTFVTLEWNEIQTQFQSHYSL